LFDFIGKYAIALFVLDAGGAFSGEGSVQFEEGLGVYMLGDLFQSGASPRTTCLGGVEGGCSRQGDATAGLQTSGLRRRARWMNMAVMDTFSIALCQLRPCAIGLLVSRRQGRVREKK
jgi:hypothetical protein